MRWIFENLNVIIVIAGAIAWWLNQRARERAGEEADYDNDGTPEVPPRQELQDPELADRTRQIRAEIQRKIEERRRAGEGYGRPAADDVPALELEEPPPVPPRRAAVEPPPVIRRVEAPAPASLSGSRRMAELLEQQATLAQQLQQAKDLKATALRRVAFEKTTADTRAADRSENRRAVLAELRDRDALKRAFIQREILGPPVGLR